MLEHHKHDGTSLALHRQYVYGLDYIDEVVAYYDSADTPTDPHFILQDVNYNVVGITDSAGDLVEQYSYHPYGQYSAAETVTAGTPTSIDLSTGLGSLRVSKGHQGLWRDPETGLYFTPGRYYDPILGRWLQRDPNQTAMLINSAMASNGQTMAVLASLSATGQYNDGLSLYGYLRNNPFNGVDPAGSMTLTELASTMGIQGVVGGVVNGFVAKMAGGSFLKGFVSGAVGGALGGGAGFAFTAGRAGFMASVVAGGFAEGFVEGTVSTYVNEGDLRAALADGLAGALVGAATGGIVHAGGKALDAFRAFRAAKGAQAAPFTGACFVAGTLVVMADGSHLPIEDVRTGDQVRCAGAESFPGATVCDVQATHTSSVSEIIELTVDDLDQALRVSPEHPLWIENVGWTRAGAVAEGQSLVTSAGQATCVECTRVAKQPTEVFNITVDGSHTYFVTRSALLVHNKPMQVAPLGASVDDFVDLASPERRIHILDGDATSGGHRWPGKLKKDGTRKTPFPENWSDDKIMHYVSDIATDPKLEWCPQPGWKNRYRIWGTRDGVRIRVVVEQPGIGIVTAFPD